MTRNGVRGAFRRRGGRAVVAFAIALSVCATDAAVGRAAEPTPPVDPPSAGADAELGIDSRIDVGVNADAGLDVGVGDDGFASTRGAVPVGPRQMFVGDFETGDFRQWDVCQSKLTNGRCSSLGRGNRAMSIVDAPAARQGNHAARFTVRPGDVPNFGGGERSEVQSSAPGALVHEGDERWYEWSVQYPQDMPDVSGRYFIILQWHSSSGSPPLAIDLSRGSVDIGGDGVKSAPRRTIGPIRRGEWVDYVLHVKFSRNGGTGYVEAWENGRRTVPRTNRATMVDGENYLKQGIYRGSNSRGVVSLTMDGLRVTAP